MQILFEWQGQPQEVTAYSDVDWAGDKQSRKSTSGGCLVLGNHLVKGCAKTQALIAFSLAESELYAALKTSAEALGLIPMAKDMGYKLIGRVWGDAGAALGIIHRKGLGRTRHNDTSSLWVQQVAAERRLMFEQILGKENPRTYLVSIWTLRLPTNMWGNYNAGTFRGELNWRQDCILRAVHGTNI